MNPSKLPLPLTSTVLRLRPLVSAVLLGLGLGACGSQSLGDENSKPDPDPEIQPGPEKLDVFESCDDLLAETKARAKAALDLYPDYWGFYSHGEHENPDSDGHELRVPRTGDELHAKGGVPVQVGGGEGAEHSETSVWEAGVDEMAVMKTDGERLLALASAADGERLHYVDVSGASPQLRGSVELGMSLLRGGFFLHEDRALVFVQKYYGGEWEGVPDEVKEHFGEDFAGFVLELVELDVSDPDNLKILRRLHASGELASARMVDGVVRVVLHSLPSGLAMKLPGEFLDPLGDFEAAQAQAREYNKTVVDASTLGNWLPRYVLEDMSQETNKVGHGLIVGCEQVLQSGAPAGLLMTSVLTLDLNAGIGVGKNVGIFSGIGAVAASPDSLYMTTRPWMPETQGQTTYVHKFDIQGAERAKYVASGEVHGWNRYVWSLSEWKGDLRVLSTDDVESFVSVLRQEGDALVQVGQVGGLAPLNSLQGVRFVGETGYVAVGDEWRAKLGDLPATRLTVVALSEPTQPTVVGELPEIPGILEYLHPVGEGLILAVGHNNDPEARQLRLSLFDVADKAAPKLLHTLGTNTDTDIDHEDFLWWEKTGMAMLPAYFWEPEQGAQGFHVDAEAGIILIGAVHHPDTQGCGSDCTEQLRVQQALVVGELVYTLSDVGLKASALSDLSDKHWLEFPQ